MTYKKLMEILGQGIVTARLFNEGDKTKLYILQGMNKALNILDASITWGMASETHIDYICVSWKNIVERIDL